MDALSDIAQSVDGGFYVAGSTGSTNVQIWIVRLNGDGDEIWNQRYDGEHYLFWPSIQATPDGGILMAAETWADAADSQSTDLMLLKLAPDAIAAPRLMASPGSGFRLFMSGISNRTYITESSGDLQTWSPLVTNQLTYGVAEILDNRAGAKRFYRARMV